MKKGLKWKNLIILVLVVYIIFSFFRQNIAIGRIKEDIAQKHIELDKLKEENKRLDEQVKSANSNEYIEKLARERLGMVKHDEKIVSNKKDDSNSKE